MKPYYEIFSEDIQSVIKTGMSILSDFPESRKSLMRLMSHLPVASKRRDQWMKKDIVVPPLLIISTTESCNLNCAGCYARSNHGDVDKEIPKEKIDDLMEQAIQAGCCIVLLAGGEPLMCNDWLDVVASHSELLGLVFTNGTILNNERADWFAENRNMIPLFSIEGDAKATDERRGSGVAERVEHAMRLLTERALPFGVSLTVGEHNIEDILRQDFIDTLVPLGCRLFIFPEYVPAAPNEKLHMLSEESKLKLQDFCRKISKEKKLILIPFPGDESEYGGCLAAGRGFVHISVFGELEPCPFAEYSDRNVYETSLIDALASSLLSKIRSESHLLKEGAGGCALRGLNWTV